MVNVKRIGFWMFSILLTQLAPLGARAEGCEVRTGDKSALNPLSALVDQCNPLAEEALRQSLAGELFLALQGQDRTKSLALASELERAISEFRTCVPGRSCSDLNFELPLVERGGGWRERQRLEFVPQGAGCSLNFVEVRYDGPNGTQIVGARSLHQLRKKNGSPVTLTYQILPNLPCASAAEGRSFKFSSSGFSIVDQTGSKNTLGVKAVTRALAGPQFEFRPSGEVRIHFARGGFFDYSPALQTFTESNALSAENFTAEGCRVRQNPHASFPELKWKREALGWVNQREVLGDEGSIDEEKKINQWLAKLPVESL